MWTTRAREGMWERPSWDEQWFPQAFKGTMGQLMRAIQDGAEPEQSGIFRYHFGSRFYDVALRIQPGISGPQIHLTILPYLSEPTLAVNRVA